MKSLEFANEYRNITVKSMNDYIDNCDKYGQEINECYFNMLEEQLAHFDIIKQDLEDYSIIREIENNVRDGKKVVLNDKKYYVCEFILAEHSTVRHLTILYNNYKKILRLEDYKKFWKFED